MPSRHIGRLDDMARLRIQRAGSPDSNAFNLGFVQALFRKQLLGGIGYTADHHVRINR
ncbi:hypothetical protein D3C79_1079210 [compost metagenome]